MQTVPKNRWRDNWLWSLIKDNNNRSLCGLSNKLENYNVFMIELWGVLESIRENYTLKRSLFTNTLFVSLEGIYSLTFFYCLLESILQMCENTSFATHK